MGPPERLNLRWSDFEANARLSFMKLRDEREFNDVTVVADCGKQVEANKLVLAGGSSFFHKILKENPHPHPLIYLKGVGYKHLVYLLDFVYTGETSIVEDDLNNFLDIAQDLKVKGLTMPGTLEPCLSPSRVSHPSPRCGTSSTPAPHQDQAAGMLYQSRPQSITSTCPAEEASTPEITPLHSVKFDLPHDQVAAKVTSPSPSISNPHSLKCAPHEYKVIAENRVQSCRLPSSRSGQLAAEEAAKSLGLQRPKSAMSFHLNNAFSQDPCEEDHDNTCLVKVKVGDFEHNNISYDVNDHGEASISHVSIRSLEENEGNINLGEDIVLSAEQDQNDNVISKEEIMESANDKVIREAAEGVFKKQMPQDWYQQGEQIDNIILGINEHDKNKIKPDGENKSDFQCLLCSITFTTSSQLRRHRKSHLNEKDSKTSSQMGSSNKLKRIHAGEKPHKCVECPKTFSYLSKLKLHKMTHTGEKPHKCVQCPKTFSYLSHLKLHKMTHSGEKPHKCVQCPKTFSCLGTLKRHKMINHTVEKRHKCVECPKTYSYLCHLKLHKMTHTREKAHKCVQCPKTFREKSSLKLHMKTHTVEKPHKCVECPKTFRVKGSLKRHKMINHTGEKRHQCVECPKTFSELGKLKRHKIIHTGEKPHRCDLCTKSFSLLDNLKRHKIIHTGEKPYQCDLCSKSFSQLDTLKQHKMTHTQKKQCAVCSRLFSRWDSLRKHKRAHCGEKP